MASFRASNVASTASLLLPRPEETPCTSPARRSREENSAFDNDGCEPLFLEGLEGLERLRAICVFADPNLVHRGGGRLGNDPSRVVFLLQIASEVDGVVQADG